MEKQDNNNSTGWIWFFIGLWLWYSWTRDAWTSDSAFQKWYWIFAHIGIAIFTVYLWSTGHFG